VKRDLVELLLGVGVMAVGLVILLFTLWNALALAQNPGAFLENQIPDQPQPPSASFDWTGTDRVVTFTDTSRAGDGAIVSWSWDFGDGNRSGAQTPSHQYAADGVYQASLVVEDSNGARSTGVAQVDVVTGATRSGRSIGGVGEGLDLDLGGILLPFAVAFLTFGLYIVMAMVGGAVLKAGWNLIKPRPETIRVRLKPSHLTRQLEEDAAAALAPSGMRPPVPPPPNP